MSGRAVRHVAGRPATLVARFVVLAGLLVVISYASFEGPITVEEN